MYGEKVFTVRKTDRNEDKSHLHVITLHGGELSTRPNLFFFFLSVLIIHASDYTSSHFQ